MIVCLHNNKTTQQKIAETIHIIIRKIKIVKMPSSYNKYLQYLYDLPISTSIWKNENPWTMTIVNMSHEWREQIVSPVIMFILR